MGTDDRSRTTKVIDMFARITELIERAADRLRGRRTV